MSKPGFKVVGEITPPDYKDPAKMLRNLADDIEQGKHGEVNTISIVTFGDAGLEVYGGGRDSDGASVHLALSAACAYMQRMLLPITDQ